MYVIKKDGNILYAINSLPSAQEILDMGGDTCELISHEETPGEKLDRITNALVSSEDPTTVNTEGVTGFDIQTMITNRFFGGDKSEELEYTQRMVYLQSKTRTPDEDIEMEKIIAGYEAKESFKNFIKSLNK